MPPTPSYPTRAHERAAESIVAFFAARDEPDAVLLTNSCARGKATPDSCLDVLVLAPAGADRSIPRASRRPCRATRVVRSGKDPFDESTRYRLSTNRSAVGLE